MMARCKIWGDGELAATLNLSDVMSYSMIYVRTLRGARTNLEPGRIVHTQLPIRRAYNSYSAYTL